MHVAPFNTSRFLDYAEISHAPEGFFDDPVADVSVDYFAPPEHHNDFHLVTIFKETKDVFNLEVEIVVVRAGPELDLFDYDIFLFRPGSLLPLGLHELVLAIVHDPADRWIGGGGNLYKIQTLISGDSDCFGWT